MALAALVKHHPSRADRLPALLDALEMPALVVTDPEPDAKPSAWRCMSACLERLDELPADADHVVVVEDDALPCPGFARSVHRMVKPRAASLIVLYVAEPDVEYAAETFGWDERRLNDWLDEQRSRRIATWLPLTGGLPLLPVVANVWPRPLLEQFREWAARNPPPESHADDPAAVTKFARDNGVEILATVPSLVDHDDDETPSIIAANRGPDAKARIAWRFAEDGLHGWIAAGSPFTNTIVVPLDAWPEGHKAKAYIETPSAAPIAS